MMYFKIIYGLFKMHCAKSFLYSHVENVVLPIVLGCQNSYYLHLTKSEALRCLPKVSWEVIKLINEHSSVFLQILFIFFKQNFLRSGNNTSCILEVAGVTFDPEKQTPVSFQVWIWEGRWCGGMSMRWMSKWPWDPQAFESSRDQVDYRTDEEVGFPRWC